MGDSRNLLGGVRVYRIVSTFSVLRQFDASLQETNRILGGARLAFQWLFHMNLQSVRYRGRAKANAL
jgi:hypothetical protein